MNLKLIFFIILHKLEINIYNEIIYLKNDKVTFNIYKKIKIYMINSLKYRKQWNKWYDLYYTELYLYLFVISISMKIKLIFNGINKK